MESDPIATYAELPSCIICSFRYLIVIVKCGLYTLSAAIYFGLFNSSVCHREILRDVNVSLLRRRCAVSIDQLPAEIPVLK